jgi:hypothetical protein
MSTDIINKLNKQSTINIYYFQYYTFIQSVLVILMLISALAVVYTINLHRLTYGRLQVAEQKITCPLMQQRYQPPGTIAIDSIFSFQLHILTFKLRKSGTAFAGQTFGSMLKYQHNNILFANKSAEVAR